MSKMSHNELLDGLAQYGYELNRPTQRYKGEDVLLNLVKENDSRLLEGFPVAYENILNQKKHLDWDMPDWDFRKTLSDHERSKFMHLLLVSYLLFNLYGEDKSKLEETERVLSKLSERWRESLKKVEDDFSHSDAVKLGNKVELSTERLKNQFRNYVVYSKKSDLSQATNLNLELELLLSQFFTPKQKELLKKRLNSEVLSKTEKEYFYRVVSKRLKALSNENLYQFVKTLI